MKLNIINSLIIVFLFNFVSITTKAQNFGFDFFKTKKNSGLYCHSIFNPSKRNQELVIQNNNHEIYNFLEFLKIDENRIHFEEHLRTFNQIGDQLIIDRDYDQIPVLIEHFLKYSKKYIGQPKDYHDSILKDYFRTTDQFIKKSNFEIVEIPGPSNLNHKLLFLKTKIGFNLKDLDLISVFILSSADSSFEKKYFVESMYQLKSNFINETSKKNNPDENLIVGFKVGGFDNYKFKNYNETLNIYQQDGGVNKTLQSDLSQALFNNISHQILNSNNSLHLKTLSEFESNFRIEEDLNLLTYFTITIDSKHSDLDLREVRQKFLDCFLSLSSREETQKKWSLFESNLNSKVVSIKDYSNKIINEKRVLAPLTRAQSIGFNVNSSIQKVQDFVFSLNELFTQNGDTVLNRLIWSNFPQLNELLKSSHSEYYEFLDIQFKKKLDHYVKTYSSDQQYSSFNEIKNLKLRKEILKSFVLEMLLKEDGPYNEFMLQTNEILENENQFKQLLTQVSFSDQTQHQLKIKSNLENQFYFSINQDNELVVVGYSKNYDDPIQAIKQQNTKVNISPKRLRIINHRQILKNGVVVSPLIFIAVFP